MNKTSTVHPGHCHCGELAFEFATMLPPDEWALRQCQCDYCRSQGAVWTSDPRGSIRFHTAHAAAMTRYRFGQRSADFLLCSRCGTLIAALAQIEQARFGIINVRALDAGRDSLPPARAVDYAHESPSTRDQRRRQNWTPVHDFEDQR